MRIAYVALHLGREVFEGGVGNKIRTQTRLWREAGHDARIFLLTPDDLGEEGVDPFVFHASTEIPFLKFIAREVRRSKALALLISAVSAYKPDIIYLRFGLYSSPLVRLFRVAPVVVEINSNDVDEYKYRGSFFYWMNRLTRRIALSRASGFVVPSREISQLPENLKFQKRTKVISNGIDTRSCVQYPPPENDLPALVFVATPGYAWHGIDKLLELAVLCPDLRIELVGYGEGDIHSTIPDNMTLHGFLNKQHIGNIISKADVAVGTLALHRKNMQEASPLKVREALCHGIPMILAYDDTDLMDLDMDYILKLPNTEENIRENYERIREFCYAMKGKRVDREVILPRIDQRAKEAERLAFLDGCISKMVAV